MNTPSPFQPAHSPCPWCDPLGRLGSPFTVYFCRPFLLRCPSSFLHFFCVVYFFVPSSLCNYFRNDDNESALKYNLLRSVVVCIVAARHSGWAKQNMSGRLLLFFFPYVLPSIRCVVLCSLLGGTKCWANSPCGVHNRRNQVNVSPVRFSAVPVACIICFTIPTYPFSPHEMLFDHTSC